MKRGFVLKSAGQVGNNSRNMGPKSMNRSYALPPLGLHNQSFLDKISSLGGGGMQTRNDARANINTLMSYHS
jgi:hypothetical protein